MPTKSQPLQAEGGEIALRSPFAGRDESKVRALGLLAGYLVVVLLPLSLAALTQSEGGHSFAGELGRALGLIAFPMLIMQVVLASRIKFIEREFGLDILMGFHKRMGIVAFAFLLAHPILMAFGEGSWGLLIDPGVTWGVWVGRVTIILLAATVIVALGRKALRIRFETWRRGHNVLAVSVLSLGFTHSLVEGHDFENAAPVLLWTVFALMGAAAYLYIRLPSRFHPHRSAYLVADITRESPDVTTLRLAPVAGESPMKYLPGQFIFLRLGREGRPLGEEHPFSISSSPLGGDLLSVTIKNVGDFTATIGDTWRGDDVIVEGPYGKFGCLTPDSSRPKVMIAGGIGITPLMSMLRYMRDLNMEAQVKLVHFARSETDLVFREEITRMGDRRSPSTSYIPVLTQPATAWKGRRGRPSGDLFRELRVGENLEEDYYVCGPPTMTRKVIKILRGMDVPPSHIFSERFEL